MRAVAGGRSRRSSWRPMRSAESAIGVNGFLISCATRRATSCHAAAFCARSNSLVSSSTTTKPEVYAKAGALADAAKIRDPLLLIHGMADDNVVFENSSELIAKLQ